MTDTSYTLSKINRGYTPCHERPHDPPTLRVLNLKRILATAPRISSLKDCIDCGELPSPFLYPELHMSVEHEYVPSFSLRGGRPHPQRATILYRVPVILLSDRILTSRIVANPVAYYLESFSLRSIPGKSYLYEIKNLMTWANTDEIFFHETCPPLGN